MPSRFTILIRRGATLRMNAENFLIGRLTMIRSGCT
jgi:hypothetical protein